jgi:hypothetical protein
VVDNQSWYSDTPEGKTGPGWYEVTGHASADVSQVDVELSDHTTTTASLSDGRFSARVTAGRDVTLFNERITWTLSDGTTHTRRADLLDTETDAERCALTVGCVPARLAALLSRAIGAQRAALEDGIVTDDEYHQALENVADCAQAADGSVDVIGLTLQIGGDTDSAIVARCESENSELVGQARDLTHAVARIAEDSSLSSTTTPTLVNTTATS